jgi:glucokinase
VAGIVRAVSDVVHGRDVDAVGLAIAGNVTADGSQVLFSPHLPLAGEPICADLQSALGLRVVVENDANAAAFAEAAMGSAAGSADVLMVTVGTGLGSGLVLGGELYRGHHGFAGEAGHMTVVVDGRPCPCGSRGCWERYASGTALVARYLERGGDPELDGPAIGRLAAGGDAVAEAALTDVGEWLGRGLASLVAVLDPEVIVVGGGVSESGNRLLEPARHHMRANLTGADRRPAPEIRQAALGNDAGVIGAAMLASQR